MKLKEYAEIKKRIIKADEILHEQNNLEAKLGGLKHLRDYVEKKDEKSVQLIININDSAFVRLDNIPKKRIVTILECAIFEVNHERNLKEQEFQKL